MRTDIRRIAFAYLRLSNEEAAEGESSSIKNQRMIIQDYCERNEILLVRVFIDDGWSGGNFDRPAFQEMIALLEQGKANIVITKDLSRLGRDMREASYYAEQYCFNFLAAPAASSRLSAKDPAPTAALFTPE